MTSDIERTCERLWSISNGAAVFSAAQFVTLIFAIAGQEFRQAIAAPGVRPAIVVIILVLTAAQVWAITWCNGRLIELERSDNQAVNRITKTLARGRILVVVLFAVLSALVLFIGPFSWWLSH